MKDIHARRALQPTRRALLKSRERGLIRTSQSTSFRPFCGGGSGGTLYTHAKLAYRRTATLEDRMQHLESLIQSIPAAVFAAGGGAGGAGGGGGAALPLNNPLLQPGTQQACPTTTTTTTDDPNAIPMAPFMYPASGPYASGVPPPSLHVFPLTNPSTHFKRDGQAYVDERGRSPIRSFNGPFSVHPASLLEHHHPAYNRHHHHHPHHPHLGGEETSKLSLTASYLYIDDEGYTRWQGETSGLPVLDLLVERHSLNGGAPEAASSPGFGSSPTTESGKGSDIDWFPDRKLKRTDMNPQALWGLVTSSIAPDLMDR